MLHSKRPTHFTLLAFSLALLGISVTSQVEASSQSPDAQPGEQIIANYFQYQVKQIESGWLQGIETLDDWRARREHLRQELLEMLGLSPLPQRTDLKVTITGTVETEDFIVEKLHYQSMPGLYVTANLYRPKQIDKPLPVILYLCGHARVEKDGVSYGNKVSYQHHPAWFARHGFVSMAIDTIQLGEIPGLHHGTNRENMWWWNAHGYTPAGVETWNAMRALDYLQTRPEVDGNRLGVTGRSGGGVYSWWLAALDDRIKVAVPVAGMTDLQNYVVDGAIEGHCDCMFMVNTHRWDFPQVAALVAPRPLLLANSDKDVIFPLDGVERLHWKVREVYRLYGAEDRLGLLITEGPHKDTQDLRIPTFHWMNRWLKKEEEDPPIEKPAIKFFEPEQLKVFSELPADERTSQIHESFVPQAREPNVPRSFTDWQRLQRHWLQALKAKSFRGWPEKPGPLNVEKVLELVNQGLQLEVYDFDSQKAIRLRLWLLRNSKPEKPKQVILTAVDEVQWKEWLGGVSALFRNQLDQIVGVDTAEPLQPNLEKLEELRQMALKQNTAIATLAARGIGPTAWDTKRETHLRRRFVLLGQTLDGMRVWDVRRAIAVLSTLDQLEATALHLRGRGTMAGVLLYASLFEPAVQRLDLWSLPPTHREGPIFLNVLRFFDMPQALAMALTNNRVVLHDTDPQAWTWPHKLAENLSLDPAFQIED